MMGRIHTIFLMFSALAFSLLLFGEVPSSDGKIQFVRIGLILMVPVLLGSLLLHGRPKKQVSVLKTVRMAMVLLISLYYYFSWSVGAFSEWPGGEGQFWEFISSWVSPVLGYIFLSLSVRVLIRNLKLLSQMDRLRGQRGVGNTANCIQTDNVSTSGRG